MSHTFMKGELCSQSDTRCVFFLITESCKNCALCNCLSLLSKKFSRRRTFWRNSDEIVCYFSDMACCVFNPSPKSQVLICAALSAGSPRAGRTPWGGGHLSRMTQFTYTYQPMLWPGLMQWMPIENIRWSYCTPATNMTGSADITPWETMILLRSGNKVVKIEHVEISCLSITIIFMARHRVVNDYSFQTQTEASNRQTKTYMPKKCQSKLTQIKNSIICDELCQACS